MNDEVLWWRIKNLLLDVLCSPDHRLTKKICSIVFFFFSPGLIFDTSQTLLLLILCSTVLECVFFLFRVCLWSYYNLELMGRKGKLKADKKEMVCNGLFNDGLNVSVLNRRVSLYLYILKYRWDSEQKTIKGCHQWGHGRLLTYHKDVWWYVSDMKTI